LLQSHPPSLLVSCLWSQERRYGIIYLKTEYEGDERI
jgi:hypothetical protein